MNAFSKNIFLYSIRKKKFEKEEMRNQKKKKKKVSGKKCISKVKMKKTEKEMEN